MMVVFEVFLRPAQDADKLFTEATLKETNAVVMTLPEAEKLIQGVKADSKGREQRFVTVAKRDAPWIQRALETSPMVSGFSMHDVD